MKYTILGKIPSKSNCYKVITLGGHGSLAKTKALKEYERKFFLQCTERERNIQGFFKLRIDVYLESQRQDLDNPLKTFLDCLQQCHVIKNDNTCIEIIARKFIDKVNPRVEYELEEVEL